MIRQRARLVGVQMALLDTLLLAAMFPLAYVLREGWPSPDLPPLYPFEQYLIVLVVSVPTCLLSLWLNEVYRYRIPRSTLREAFAVIRAMAAAGIAVTTLAFFLRWHFLSRSFLALFFVLATAALIGAKILARLAFRFVGRRRFEERNILVIGDGDQLDKLVEAIRVHKNWGLRLLGQVTLGEEEAGRADVRRLGTLEELQAILDQHAVDEVVFAVSRERFHLVDHAVELCELMGICTRLAVNLAPRAAGKLSFEEFHGVPLLTLSSAPDNEISFALRRTINLALSAVFLALTFPLLLLSCLLIKLEDGGPILFKQERCGLNGRKFTLLKLRTMVADADERKEDLLPQNEMSGPVFKIRRDPRVTRVGAYLRRFSIDELPQLINVLKGDMALVGPRPPIPEEVERYERWQRRRLSMKPGMTGLWQVSGRSELDFDEWMKLDLKYIDSWSLWLDFTILIRTIPAVLSGRGAR